VKSTPTFLICFLLFSLNSCIPIKSIFLAKPDAKDLKRFDHAVVQAGNDCFEFNPDKHQSGSSIKISDWANDIPFFVPIDTFVRSHEIRSLLVIQNDSLKYEYYRDDLNENDLHSSYSVAKSFTSALVGIAIEEGHLQSEQELVVKYIPELADVPYADKLTIEHLLNHTSGIQYSLVADATIYYGRDALKAIRKIKFETLPGTQQHYLNINVELLGLVLQRVTGVSPSKYLEEKIWKPIGMCADGVWSVDEKNQLEKSFCCIGATALDYAKFGRLYLNRGMWNGKRVISESWYNKSIRRNTTQGSSFNYNYCWHIGLREYGDFMANGLYKQHIYINPKKNLIIVVFNDREKALKAERINWWFVFRQIADQL
jgi:CubicO group peptidase (beta-lactamase class C family)